MLIQIRESSIFVYILGDVNTENFVFRIFQPGQIQSFWEAEICIFIRGKIAPWVIKGKRGQKT